MSSIPLLIDTDPGVDDALAILMALRHAQHRVVALTIAAGNVGLEHTVRNARSLVDIAGSATPIFPGCPAPLLHAAEDAAFVHGQDGFGDVALPEPSTRVESEHAALAMLRLSHEHAGALTMVMLGPLTNLALALKLDPTLPGRVPRLLIMGGAVNLRGNTSVAAEFNVAFDPEAARIVFRSNAVDVLVRAAEGGLGYAVLPAIIAGNIYASGASSVRPASRKGTTCSSSNHSG